MDRTSDRYLKILKEHYIQEIDPVTVGIAGATLSALIAFWYNWAKFIKKAKDADLQGKCRNLKGKDYKKCNYTVQIKMMQKYLSKIPEMKAKCAKVKEPKKCAEFFKKREEKIKEKTQKLQTKLANL